MKKKHIILAILLLPLTFCYAQKINKSKINYVDDTLIVDKEDLINTLRSIAIKEFKNKHKESCHGITVNNKTDYRPILREQQHIGNIPNSNQILVIPRSDGSLKYYIQTEPYKQQNVQNDSVIENLKKQIHILRQSLNSMLSKNLNDSIMKKQIDLIESKLRVLEDTKPIDTYMPNLSPIYIEKDKDENKDKNMFDTNFRQVFFNVSSDELPNEAKKTLEYVANILKENRALKVTINGFASKEGNEDFNNSLAIRRVKSVKLFLLENGVEISQIKSLFTGIDNSSEMRTYARRVDLLIL